MISLLDPDKAMGYVDTDCDRHFMPYRCYMVRKTREHVCVWLGDSTLRCCRPEKYAYVIEQVYNRYLSGTGPTGGL